MKYQFTEPNNGYVISLDMSIYDHYHVYVILRNRPKQPEIILYRK